MPADPASDRSSRDRPPWAALGAAAIIVPTVLAGLTLAWPRQPVESTLTDASNSALTAAGINGAAVRFDGRDGTISGVSGADAARAMQVVEGVTGVRIAQIAGGAGSPPPIALPPSLSPMATTTEAAPTSSTPSASASAAPSPSAGATALPAPAAPPSGSDLDAAAKQALQAKLTALLGAAPITFGPDSAQLTTAGRASLAAVLQAVRTAPGARLDLTGWVAPGPGNGELTAAQLSDQRASVVRDAMVAGGVPADHLTARGRGNDTTRKDRALARRVDITVV